VVTNAKDNDGTAVATLFRQKAISGCGELQRGMNLRMAFQSGTELCGKLYLLGRIRNDGGGAQMRKILSTVVLFSAFCSAQVANQLITISSNGHYLFNSITNTLFT
jgi:hypothetical protein